MNSNSELFDTVLPKVEVVDDRECIRIGRLNWTSHSTLKLIETLERDCHELWNTKHPGYRDKAVKQLKYENLADMFGTTVEEIARKIHNLRTQYNSELRKIRKRHGEGVSTEGSGWEYFEPMSFLKTINFNDSTPDPVELDVVNFELTDFQAEEEEDFRKAAARALKDVIQPEASGTTPGRKKPMLRVAASAPPPPPSTSTLMWTEQPLSRLESADECQIFGDFVASELRTLRSSESRKKLKRLIQKAILQVGEEDDNINQ